MTFLDDAVATYEVPKDAKGEVLFQSVVRSLDLSSESKYFGLLFTDQYDFPLWLDHDKKVCVCVCLWQGNHIIEPQPVFILDCDSIIIQHI